MRRLAFLLLLAACPGEVPSGTPDAAPTPDAPLGDAPSPPDATPPDAATPDAAPPPDASPCPGDMSLAGAACVDRYEAPNAPGALPLVMYTFTESEAWCGAHGKRLCFDDEWAEACGGPDGWPYPYGATHVLGACNDEETWLAYNQTLLNDWPASASGTGVATLDELLAAAAAVSAAAADHVESLYQGEGGGANAGCTNAYGVFDTLGNVEEWTRRRDGGEPSFHGKLKGRYWANERPDRDTVCQGGVTVHGDAFRFYEIGFRCCKDPS